MLRNIILCSALPALGICFVSAPAQAAPSDQEAQKVIKTVLTTIRLGKDDLAAKQVSFPKMAEAMMQEAWSKASADQRKEIIAGLETLIRKISFAKGRDMFKHLDNVTYGKLKTSGGRVICPTTVVVHREYKKKEVVIDFVLVQDGGAWKIMDTIMLGESTAEGIYEDQVEPLVDEGGIEAVLAALRKKLKEVN